MVVVSARGLRRRRLEMACRGYWSATPPRGRVGSGWLHGPGRRTDGCSNEEKRQKSRQHPDFPGGHPPEYYPSLRLLNFTERTGYGVLSLRWPSTTSFHEQTHCFNRTPNTQTHTHTHTYTYSIRTQHGLVAFYRDAVTTRRRLRNQPGRIDWEAGKHQLTRAIAVISGSNFHKRS